MSLHDIDKAQDNRGIPRPNENDQQNQRMAHNTLATTYKNEGSASVPRLIFKNGLILTYDEDNRVSSVYGYVPEVSNVPIFVIAKDGFDVFIDILGIDPPVV